MLLFFNKEYKYSSDGGISHKIIEPNTIIDMQRKWAERSIKNGVAMVILNADTFEDDGIIQLSCSISSAEKGEFHFQMIKSGDDEWTMGAVEEDNEEDEDKDFYIPSEERSKVGLDDDDDDDDDEEQEDPKDKEFIVNLDNLYGVDLTKVKGVGKASAEHLKSIGIKDCKDLFHAIDENKLDEISSIPGFNPAKIRTMFNYLIMLAK